MSRLSKHETGAIVHDRKVVGLMSGTSFDGVDVAVVQLSGSGQGLTMDVQAFGTAPYPNSLRERLLRNIEPDTSSISDLSQLNADLALIYADAVRSICLDQGVSLESIDLVGSHGQTVYHDPHPALGAGSSLQIGDPSMLAHHLGKTVVGDFRTADVALGGEGAPLVPYFDWALFSSIDEYRILLNLGGMANITILPAATPRDQVIAFDTGPANVLIDGLMARIRGEAYDQDGALAVSGSPDEVLVDEVLAMPYFAKKPPKSTGRELFNAAFIDDFRLRAAKRGLSVADTIASATSISGRSILDAIGQWALGQPDRLIVGGGGVHNKAIMSALTKGLPGTAVQSSSDFGLDPDAKEAVCFAVLAHEAANGVACGIPSVTGARARAFLGKICPPGK